MRGFRVGCDVVSIPRFRTALVRGGDGFLTRLFLPTELAEPRAVESLAGMMAAKEAVLKALALPIGSWHSIEIAKEESGRPVTRLFKEISQPSSLDISISHDGDYAFAVAVAAYEDAR